MPLLAKSLLLALLYYMLVVVALKLRLSDSTLALIWPSNALLIAVLLLNPKRQWWVYLLAVIPAHIAGMSSYHVGFWWLVYQILSNSAMAIGCAAILQRFRPAVLHFETLKEVLIFLVVAVGIPALVSVIAVYVVEKLASQATLSAHGWSHEFGPVWAGRWITNSASIMVFVPAILVCITEWRSWLRNLSWRRFGEAALLALLVVMLTFQIYGHVYATRNASPVVYLIPIPLLLWAAVRFGSAGACLCLALLVSVSSWCAYLGEGPFLRSVSIDRVVVLQLFWMMISAPVLALAAVIQERRMAHQATLESEERFRYLFSQAPIGIALEDMEGNLLFVNPALCSMLGYTQQELTGMNCTQFADPEDEKEDWEQFQALRAGIVRSYQIEKRYLRKGGSRIWGQLNVSMLVRSGQPTMVLATVEDITEKRAALEELTRAHSELQQFTPLLLAAQEEERRRISRELHDDFGQRLSLLMVELDALGRELPEETAGHAKIGRLLGELGELGSDIHNMSHQLHSRKLQFLGLSAALKDICQQFGTQYHITVHLTAEELPELPREVSLCFYRVAQEALANAAKHSKSTRIEVNLLTEGKVLRMRIKDFGRGFDPEMQRSGLGLISMQERLRMIGGAMQIHTMPGQGTEVEAEASLELTELPVTKEERPAKQV